MNLSILLPFGVFATVPDVTSLTAETQHGSFGILQHRLDCVAALVPGIQTYVAGNEPVYLAAGEGVLIKQGSQIIVSIRRCIRGVSLALLHNSVIQDFLRTTAQDQAVRLAMTKMESAMLARVLEGRHE